MLVYPPQTFHCAINGGCKNGFFSVDSFSSSCLYDVRLFTIKDFAIS